MSAARSLGAALLATTLAACAPAPRAPVDSLHTLGTDEVVIVGRVELVPPLSKEEAKIRGGVIGDFENRMLLLADDKLRPMPDEPRIADYAGRIEARIGDTFFVRSKRAPFYVIGGVLFIGVGKGMQPVHFPGGLQVDVKPGERAVYIGTLRYHRDEFFEVTRVSVVDEYREANAEFGSRFGKQLPLRKALMTRAKKP